MVVIERSSSSSAKRKEKTSVSCQKESHGLLKEKLVKRASSFSCSSPSSKKEKQSMSSEKDVHELPREKHTRRASSFSKQNSSKCLKDNQMTKIKQNQTPKKSGLIKSKIKEMGPICNKRKESLANYPVSVHIVEEDVDMCLEKLIKDQEGKADPDDCLWLSSGSLSPQEFGLFMSALDPSLDEWVISFLPKSSKTPELVDGLSGEDQGEVGNEDKQLSPSSTFWNLDRTGAWVSLINLDGEDSKWLSDVDSQMEDLESDFPSPNYEISWDSYSSDVGFSSSARSTQENSQSEWSSEMLSDSMDWEHDSDHDPIFWPYGKDFGWDDQEWDSFSVSPRKGICMINFESGQEGCVSPSSIKFRLHAKKGNSKEGFKRKILLVSGLSASKIIEFKKGCRKNATTGKLWNRSSKMGKKASHYRRRVPPILENVLEEEKSPKETPKAKLSSDILPESADWVDEDSEGPLFWPSDQKNDWDQTWDSFNISPRKAIQSTNLGSPKGGFPVSSSVRLKFCSKKGKTRGINNQCGLSASKSYKFKLNSHKTNAAYLKRIKAKLLRLSKSCENLRVIAPLRNTSGCKPTMLKLGSFRTNAGHGKRIRAMPLKFGRKTGQEFVKLVPIVSKNKELSETELSVEELPIETMVGLNEFDGHEGVEPEFEGSEIVGQMSFWSNKWLDLLPYFC